MALFNLDIVENRKVILNGVEHRIEDLKMKEYIEFQRKLKNGELEDDCTVAEYLSNLMVPTINFRELSVEQYQLLFQKLLLIIRGEDTEDTEKKTEMTEQR